MARALVLLLSALLLFQGSLLASRAVRRAPQPPPNVTALSEGDLLPALRVRTERSDAPLSLVRGDGKWTAVLAFKSDCYWCGTLAPEWKAWLDRPHPFQVVAVTREPLDTATAYRDRNTWRVDVASAQNLPGDAPERYLLSRTPWVFLFDAAGRLRYQGHGSSIQALDSIHATANAGG